MLQTSGFPSIQILEPKFAVSNLCTIRSPTTGPSNHQDSFSRYPMLGPRQLAPLGLEHSIEDLVIGQPAAADSPRIVARLFRSPIPFAILMPSDLAPQICNQDLSTDLVWVLGNIEELSAMAEIHENEITTPAPLCHSSTDIPEVLLQCFANDSTTHQDDTILPSTSMSITGRPSTISKSITTLGRNFLQARAHGCHSLR